LAIARQIRDVAAPIFSSVGRFSIGYTKPGSVGRDCRASRSLISALRHRYLRLSEISHGQPKTRSARKPNSSRASSRQSHGQLTSPLVAAHRFSR
jgi:hypothetical protein